MVDADVKHPAKMPPALADWAIKTFCPSGRDGARSFWRGRYDWSGFSEGRAEFYPDREEERVLRPDRGPVGERRKIQGGFDEGRGIVGNPSQSFCVERRPGLSEGLRKGLAGVLQAGGEDEKGR